MARKSRSLFTQLVLLSVACSVAVAQNYTAVRATEDGIEVVRLADAKNGIEVTIVPSIGNRAIAINVHGKNILFSPEGGIAALQKRPGLNGVPFLAPWANRLDEAGFWADGKHYTFDPELGNVGKDQNGLPMHGLLSASTLWEVTDLSADPNSAHVTSKLEFWKHPELMAQWPFAQRYEMTYRLRDGALEVDASVVNLSAEPIPLSIGFHPYYRIPDKPRDEWTLSAPVRSAVITDNRLIPTGDMKPADLPNPIPLKDRTFDNGFTDLTRDAQGEAHFVIASGGERIDIAFGPQYPVAVIYEPPNRNHRNEFVCVEPMTALTDGINLAHEGKYNALQMVAPGSTWTGTFRIKPEGI
jgi:aldose 1-epimerase